MEWPDAFFQMRDGRGCPMCEEGRPEATGHGIRFFAGEVADAYLRRSDIQRGLTIVVWRGRHVAEPTELTDAEAVTYWRELLVVGKALEQVFEPIKLNYNLLGNSLPHLHTHVIPRYRADPHPSWPFPFPDEDPPDMPDDVLRRDIEELRTSFG